LILKFSSNISPLERKTFILHILSQFFNGITLGIISLQDILLKKTLGGTDHDVMILSLLISSSFIVSMYGSEIVNRSENKTKIILLIAAVGKIFLLVIPYITNPFFYIICIGANAYMDSLLLPVWNIVFKHNYSDINRSRLYSYASIVQTVFIIIITSAFGYYLDIYQDIYRYAFPVAALTGFLAYYELAMMIRLSDSTGSIKYERRRYHFKLKLVKDIIFIPVRNTLRIFRDNPRFFRFEIYFFIYGIAFIMLTPVIPVFLVDVLKLNYFPISLAKGLIFHSAFIIFTPIMGIYYKNKIPTSYCGYMFYALAFFPAILLLSGYFNEHIETIVYLAYFTFGFAMSGVTIAWTLSSIYYSPPNQVSNYQAVHITLTGIRGIFSPVLGYIIMIYLDTSSVFITSALLFIIAGALMLLEHRNWKF